MSESVPTPEPPTRAPRFSLGTFILVSLLLGSFVGIWTVNGKLQETHRAMTEKLQDTQKELETTRAGANEQQKVAREVFRGMEADKANREATILKLQQEKRKLRRDLTELGEGVQDFEFLDLEKMHIRQVPKYPSARSWTWRVYLPPENAYKVVMVIHDAGDPEDIVRAMPVPWRVREYCTLSVNLMFNKKPQQTPGDPVGTTRRTPWDSIRNRGDARRGGHSNGKNSCERR